MSILLKGTLRKWTGIVKGYSKRYFILKTDSIEYYPNRNKLRSGKKFNLSTTEIIEANRDLIIQLSTGSAIISIKFCSEEEKKRWLTMLERAIHHSKNFKRGMELPHIDTTDKAEEEAMKRKDALESFDHKVKEKLNMLRDTLNELRKTKSSSKKKANVFSDFIYQLHLQVNDIERLCVANIDEMKSTIEAVHVHLKNNDTIIEEQESMSFTDPNEIEREPSQARVEIEGLLGKEYTMQANPVKKSMIVSHRKENLRSNSQDFDEEFKNGEAKDYKETPLGTAHEELKAPIDLDEDISPRKSDYPEDEEEKVEELSEDEGSLEYYDAVDYMIYDELEKSMYEENQRRQTVLIQDHKRTTLPALKPKASINIFKILKDSIGKDLTKFCVPVYFNEPLSMLQKVGEIMQNEEVISGAAEQTDSLLRLVYVTGFCISQYGGTQFRCSKPFNPILGETFEMKSKNWKFIAEQVSHHPPISA